MKIHHIGYAVSNIQQSIEQFQKLGFRVEKQIVKDEKRKVEIAFMSSGNYLVELLCPLSEDSPVTNYLNKVGNTPYHFCYETDNIDNAIASLRKERYILVEKPSKATAIDGQRVAFLYNPKYGLLELLEIS